MNKVKQQTANRKIFLILFIGIIMVYGISFFQKYNDFLSFWMKNRHDYMVGNVTLLTNYDGYYWVKMARELDKGTLGKGQVEPTKGYPDLQMLAIKDTPGLLAVLISLGKNFTNGDYYRAAIFLIPVLAGLFVFPLFFYFYRLGFGASAIYGGLFATFCHAYYDRTIMGRVDTDLLNLFFPLLAACFILYINKASSLRQNLLCAFAAGLTMYLFTWWYQQPTFIFVYFLVMAVYLVAERVPWKQIGLLLLVYLLASGLEHLVQVTGSLQTFINAYVSPPPTGRIAWPNILQTVAEAQNYDVVTKLRNLHGFLPLVFTGFVGLLYLGMRHTKQMLPHAPIIALGAWSLIGPTRFVMYLAPMVGVGVGIVVELLVIYIMKKHNLRQITAAVVSVVMMFGLFFSFSSYTRFYTHAGTHIPASLVKSILDIKQVVPKNSAMFTPYWEYGYPLMELGEFATYHDGGLQGGIRTTLASIAMVSSNQRDLVSLLAYLEDYGFKPLSALIRKDNLTADQMLKLVFNYAGDFKGENVYVLYLEPMAWKLPAMSKFGTWDFEKRKSESMDYVELHCFSIVDNIMHCRDGKVDLNRGYMNDGTVDVPLSGAFFVNNGNVVERYDFDHEKGYYLQVLMKDDKAVRILVADERLYRTNFNQQYLLGNYDKRYFEEVYNDYPNARVFKVKRGDHKGSLW